MSHRSITMRLIEESISGVGFLYSPKSEWIGRLKNGWYEPCVTSPFAVVPKKPCSAA